MPPFLISYRKEMITMNDNAYVFEEPLIEGLILKRRNRFVMEVQIEDSIYDCHCPTTGRIGDIVLSNIPCLLSRSKDKARKTAFTVEAISLDLPSEGTKHWIGINQNAANRYVEHFLKNGSLSKMVENNNEVLREQKLGVSKLDFLVGNTYLEVKTPLLHLQVEHGSHIKTQKMSPFNSTDRFVKHINELANSLEKNQRAILLNCFIYDNPGFRVSVKSTNNNLVKTQVEKSIQKGVEIWQVNFRITQTKVELIRYFPINIS